MGFYFFEGKDVDIMEERFSEICKSIYDSGILSYEIECERLISESDLDHETKNKFIAILDNALEKFKDKAHA